MRVLRAWANRKLVDLQVWRAKRRAYNDRVLVVADHWDGSVQVFYHFLLGYFAPLAAWVQRTGSSRLLVRDCGPMNAWFESISDQLDVQIIKPGVALHAIVGNHIRSQIVQGLDHPGRHRKRKLIAATNAMRSLIPDVQVDGAPVLIIDRQSSDAFHRGPESETEMSGSQRRSVPNLAAECSQRLRPFSYRLVDSAHMTPGEQIAYASACRILVAQHGSGLTHMLWMPPGSTVIEIHPPLPPEAINIFRLLAQTLGHRYVRIDQSDVHAPVDGEVLVSAIRSAFDEIATEDPRIASLRP